jgi:hypothetical protein
LRPTPEAARAAWTVARVKTSQMRCIEMKVPVRLTWGVSEKSESGLSKELYPYMQFYMAVGAVAETRGVNKCRTVI